MNIPSMVKNLNSDMKKRVYRSKWKYFRTCIRFKCDQHGIRLRVVDQTYPSSKRCSFCGEINHDLEDDARIFICTNQDCGRSYDRDINAAKNLCYAPDNVCTVEA